MIGTAVSGEVEDSTTISSSREPVWEAIIDIAAYPGWAEGIKQVTVLESNDQGLPSRAHFRVDAKVAEISYVIEYRYEGFDVAWHLIESEFLSRLDGSYQLREVDESTIVTYRLRAETELPLPDFLMTRAAKSLLTQGLQGLKKHVEAQV